METDFVGVAPGGWDEMRFFFGTEVFLLIGREPLVCLPL